MDSTVEWPSGQAVVYANASGNALTKVGHLL